MTETKTHRKTLFSLVAVVAGMFMLAYASVPLYQLFCKVTGTGGTTQVADAAPEKMGERVMKIEFNADTDPNLPWQFKPEQRRVSVTTGEQKLAFFSAENASDKAVKGTATYNVTPAKAGIYFNKVQCFCFNEQVLQPGQKVMMPVSFFVDPEIENDPNLRGVKTITLSYTFFKVKESS